MQDLVVGAVGLQDGLEAHDAEVVEELVDIQVVQVQPVVEDLQGGGAELEVDQGAVGVEGDDLSHGVQPRFAGFGGVGFRTRSPGSDDRVECGQVGRVRDPVGRRRVGGDLFRGHMGAEGGARGAAAGGRAPGQAGDGEMLIR